MSAHERNQQRHARRLLADAGARFVTLNPSNGIGEPDLLGSLHGIAFAIEIKQPGEDPTTIQREILRRWSLAGAVICVARSADDVRWVIRECARRADPRDASPAAATPRTIIEHERKAP